MTFAVVAGVIWWKAFIMACLMIGAFSLGYGSSLPYWRKALTFISYSLTTLILGFTAWQIVMPVLCLLVFWLSNWKPTARMFTWRVAEWIYGSVLGITVAVLI